MVYYTYAYLREDRSPYYIGKGQGNRAYRRRHKGIKPPKDKSRILILKNNLTEEEAFRHEVYMIAVFGRKDLGTGILHNRTDGGEGVSGSKLPKTEETKRKISDANKGKTLSEEHKRKISDANKGKTRSEEYRRKLSESLKGKNHHGYGKTRGEETKRKISESLKGENHFGYGKTLSEEHKKKLSEAKKGKNNPNYGKRWWNNGQINTRMSKCPGDGWILGRKKN